MKWCSARGLVSGPSGQSGAVSLAARTARQVFEQIPILHIYLADVPTGPFAQRAGLSYDVMQQRTRVPGVFVRAMLKGCGVHFSKVGWPCWRAQLSGLFRPPAHFRPPVALRGVFALLLASLLSACSTDLPPEILAQMSTPQEMRDTPIVAAPIGPGDILEVAFFHGTGQAENIYKVQPDDVLSITVLDHPELTRPRVLVLPDGHISAPGVARMRAAGSTVEDLSAELARRYVKLRVLSPRVSVAVTQADSRLRSLMQPRPGAGNGLTLTIDPSGYIDLPFIEPVIAGRPLSLIQTEIQEAYQNEFQGRLEVTVNLRSRAPPRVFVMGEVNAPGSVTFASPLTPFMAIAAAGGFQDSANRKDVRLLRQRPDGGFNIVLLGMSDDMREGLTDDMVAMRPNDVIFVPRTGIAMANVAVEQYIRNMLPTQVGFGLGYNLD